VQPTFPGKDRLLDLEKHQTKRLLPRHTHFSIPSHCFVNASQRSVLVFAGQLCPGFDFHPEGGKASTSFGWIQPNPRRNDHDNRCLVHVMRSPSRSWIASKVDIPYLGQNHSSGVSNELLVFIHSLGRLTGHCWHKAAL